MWHTTIIRVHGEKQLLVFGYPFLTHIISSLTNLKVLTAPDSAMPTPRSVPPTAIAVTFFLFTQQPKLFLILENILCVGGRRLSTTKLPRPAWRNVEEPLILVLYVTPACLLDKEHCSCQLYVWWLYSLHGLSYSAINFVLNILATMCLYPVNKHVDNAHSALFKVKWNWQY